jgi:queuine tRNA-ribosyltransferase
MFEIINEKGKARTGRIKINNTIIETPVFLPVATKACIKTLTSFEAQEIGINAIIVNALHIFRRAYDIVSCIGLHKFMGWKGIIFTDSGGFQSIKKFPAKVIEDGVIFRMPDGKEEIFTPEKTIEVQKRLGSDFLFALDDCPSYPYSKDRVRCAVERTVKWAERCQGKSNFVILQGGIYPELRRQCIKHVSHLDFYGYAIGGLCIGEHKEDMHKIVKITTDVLPAEQPRHLMGVGSPEDIKQCVNQGIDIFDSAFPTRNARHGTILTSQGKLNLGKKKIKGDVIDASCDCFTCKHFSLNYLNYLFKEKEPLAMRLATIHNLTFMKNFMQTMRQNISETST